MTIKFPSNRTLKTQKLLQITVPSRKARKQERYWEKILRIEAAKSRVVLNVFKHYQPINCVHLIKINDKNLTVKPQFNSEIDFITYSFGKIWSKNSCCFCNRKQCSPPDAIILQMKRKFTSENEKNVNRYTKQNLFF